MNKNNLNCIINSKTMVIKENHIKFYCIGNDLPSKNIFINENIKLDPLTHQFYINCNITSFEHIWQPDMRFIRYDALKLKPKLSNHFNFFQKSHYSFWDNIFIKKILDFNESTDRLLLQKIIDSCISSLISISFFLLATLAFFYLIGILGASSYIWYQALMPIIVAKVNVIINFIPIVICFGTVFKILLKSWQDLF